MLEIVACAKNVLLVPLPEQWYNSLGTLCTKKEANKYAG